MLHNPTIKQIVAFAAAAVLLGGSALLQGSLGRQREKYELVDPANVVEETNPDAMLFRVAPGGLRAVGVHILWIRSNTLKEEGRFYDAMQLADMICKLQPRFPSVWSFHAWNMAWNISVACQTPEERWRWVYRGVELLRDGGIPKNPRAISLYKDLSWIFFSKMGGTTDEMHMVYKRRWAAEMQNLLGAPPYGTTREAIDAFRPIAEAPLDKDPRWQGRDAIQPAQREKLLSDPAVAAYAALLAGEGIGVDESLLAVWSRWSLDDGAAMVRVLPPRPAGDREEALSRVINSPDHKPARDRMLAFVRAQLLWNRYRMDPAWMLGLMEQYNVPLDWRSVWAHGLYWATYGIHVCQSESLAGMHAANNDRNVLNCLKDMTFWGKMVYTTNPQNPEWPDLALLPDTRYVMACHKEHIRLGEIISKSRGDEFDEQLFRSGHVNYLVTVIQMLYAQQRTADAQELFDWLRDTYKLKTNEWALPLEEFVFHKLNSEGRPIRRVADSQIASAMVTAYTNAAAGRMREFRQAMGYAGRVYQVYQKDAPERLKMRPFGQLQQQMLSQLMVRPQLYGVWLPLEARSRLYRSLDQPDQIAVYANAGAMLLRECQADPDIEFDTAFPKPPG